MSGIFIRDVMFRAAEYAALRLQALAVDAG